MAFWLSLILFVCQGVQFSTGHRYLLGEPNNIGFALVNKHLEFQKDGFAVAEFYVKKDHERNGYGREMANYLFSEYLGNWEVSVAANNNSAMLFWERVLSVYTNGNYIKKLNSTGTKYGFLFNNA